MDVNSTKEGSYTFEGFRIDGAKRIVFGPDGRALALMPKAFDILFYLVLNGGRAVDKDELMSAVWPDTIVEENNLTQNISAIRRALGEKHGDNRFIATLPGRGYKFVAEVSRLTDPPSSEIVHTNANSGSAKRWSNRYLLLALGAIILIGFATMGVFQWRSNIEARSGQIKSLAILPFKPITVDNRDEALEMGIADTLIAKLSDGNDLKVRPLAAVRRFASPEQDAIAAGRELSVEAVLDGGVQIAGDRVRITATLLRVSDGRQMWAGKFDEQLSDILAVQDSISEKVASALRIRLRDESHKDYTQNADAYQLFIRGKFHSNRLVLPELQQGIAYYQEAIAADPSFALAYVELSNVYRAMVLSNDAPPSEMMPKARAAAEKAVELDNTLAEAWMSLGFSSFWYEWDWSAADQQFKRALELDPYSSQAHAFYAHLLSNTGRNVEALAEIRRAREIDPLSSLNNAIEGQIQFFAGDVDGSILTLRSLTMVDPNFWLGHLFLARGYLKKEMWPEAIASASKARELTKGNTEATALLAFGLARSGRQAEAQTLMDELVERQNSRYVSSYTLAETYLALGKRERSLDMLEDAYARRDSLMVFLEVDPLWDEVRNESRFKELLSRMKFDQ